MSNVVEKERIDAVLGVVSDLSKKEMELRKARVESQYEHLTKQIQENDGFKNLDLSINPNRAETLTKANREYIDQAKKGAIFLGDNEFKGLVPLFARNLIFVGAQSGEGKSTLTANLAFQFLKQNKKVLVVSNEEVPEDILNRIICLNKGWSYHDHAAITEAQQVEFDRLYPVLLQRLMIVDDKYNGIGGLTTTIEGINSLLETLKARTEKYDIIIIDYFQNISTSNKNKSLSPFEVLHDVGRLLDQFKNVYNAPIVLLGTLKSTQEPEKIPFKERIEGRKSIYNFSTCCMEVRANKIDHTSEWFFAKSRFTKAIGKVVRTGFDRGRYIPYSQEFARAVEKEKNKRDLASIGVKDAQELQARMGSLKVSLDE